MTTHFAARPRISAVHARLRIGRSALTFSMVAALAIATGGVADAAPIAETQATSPTDVVSGVALTPVVSGLASPTQVISADDGSGRSFVVQQGGRIRIVKDGTIMSTPFLDLSSRINDSGEQGLLGLAFHPDFASDGRFYVYFTRKSDGAVAITEYRVSSGNPNVADPSTHRRIITIKEPYSNHNGGRMAFGPDGYLYIGTGDGGSGGDPGNRARSLTSLLGKMLRIDVDGVTRKHAYRTPASNPYKGRPGRNEIWSRGLRNPWGWSFDRLTGDLWIGDVGQSRIEEIDRALANGKSNSRGRGVDFGWRVMEGTKCYRPATGCNTSGKRTPVAQYNHSKGCAVTGGYAYRGSAVAALVGRYVFGDWCSGTIWTISRTASKLATKSVLLSTSLHITSFGQDEAGELYVLDGGGTLYRIDGTV